MPVGGRDLRCRQSDGTAVQHDISRTTPYNQNRFSTNNSNSNSDSDSDSITTTTTTTNHYLRSSSTAGGSAADAAGPDAESLMLTRGILTRFSLDVKSALKLNVSSGPEIPLPYNSNNRG